MRSLHRAFSSPCWTSTAPSAFPHRRDAPAPHHLSGPPLELIQQLHILPVLRARGLEAVLQMGPHEGRVENNPPPFPCWPPLFWCSPEYCWPSRLQAHTAGLCPAFHPSGPWSPLQDCSQWVLLPGYMYFNSYSHKGCCFSYCMLTLSKRRRQGNPFLCLPSLPYPAHPP